MPKIIETTDELKIIEEVENDKYHSLENNEFNPMMEMLKTDWEINKKESN